MYCNTEANKRLPFPSRFREYNITDPLQITEAILAADKAGSPVQDVHSIIVDSLTFMMDQYESTHVLTSSNTMKAWGEFAQFFKVLMQKHVAESTKTIIFTAHNKTVYKEDEMVMETCVPVKGSLANNGIEAYFSTVVACKKMKLRDLEKYSSSLLNITDEEKELGFKYCYQTRLTKETVNERIRSPMGMFSNSETYIDNNVQFLIDRLHQYYAQP